MKKNCSEFYRNRYQCKCRKRYKVQPLTQCCKVRHVEKPIVGCKLHDLLYITRELCLKSKEPLHFDLVSRKIDPRVNDDRLNRIVKNIDTFLETSEFENVS